MKVKINTEIDLACLFDAAHSQKEIHAMLEYLVPHASNDTIVNEIFERGIFDGIVERIRKTMSANDVKRLINELEDVLLELENGETYLEHVKRKLDNPDRPCGLDFGNPPF